MPIDEQIGQPTPDVRYVGGDIDARNDLVRSIHAEQAGLPHRYELIDPFDEVTFRYPTAGAAKTKAEDIGATRFLYRKEDGSVNHVDKVAGEWWVRGEATPPSQCQHPPTSKDRQLARVQAKVDSEAMRAILTRAALRHAVVLGLDPEIDRAMSTIDAHTFRRIENTTLQKHAAVQMSENARLFPEYKKGLDNAIPGYPGTAATVYSLAEGWCR